MLPQKKRYAELFARYSHTSLTPLLEQWFFFMLDRFGHQQWWPAESPFEVAVGAILTQNTSWKNVEKAIANLKREELLDSKRLLELHRDELAALIRPAGYYNIKAERLQNFLRLLQQKFSGDITTMRGIALDELRQILLSVKGIGPETADSILLYALDFPVFVIDAYTMRILARHDLIDGDTDYHQAQAIFMDNIPVDAALFNEYHALFVALGKDHCRARKMLCSGCPLEAT